MERVNLYSFNTSERQVLTWCPERFIENWQNHCVKSQTKFYYPKSINLIASFIPYALPIETIKNEIKNYLDILDRTDIFIAEKESRQTLLSWRYFPKTTKAYFGNGVMWKVYQTKGIDIYNLSLLDQHIVKHGDGTEYYHIFGE